MRIIKILGRCGLIVVLIYTTCVAVNMDADFIIGIVAFALIVRFVLSLFRAFLHLFIVNAAIILVLHLI